MDKNALRRKKYAEMSSDKKAAILERRRQMRLARKIQLADFDLGSQSSQIGDSEVIKLMMVTLMLGELFLLKLKPTFCFFYMTLIHHVSSLYEKIYHLYL